MHNSTSINQRRRSHPAGNPVPASSSSPQVRRRSSFRERFWTWTSANYHGEDEDSTPTSIQTTAKRTPYVPVNAASGFSRTMGAARDPTRRQSLAAMSESIGEASSSTTSPAVTQTTPLPRVPESGRPYPHSDPDTETDDYTAFMAAAEADDRARRAEQRRSVAIGGSYSRHRDSGYYSSGGGRDRDPHSQPPAPAAMALTPAPAAEPRTLKRQQSIRAVGQRIAEYVKPTRTNPTSGADTRVYRHSG